MKVHPKFKGIAITENGEIYSTHTGNKRKLNTRKDGYLQISIYPSSYLVHRLVAETYIENPEKKEKINHKNGIKTDNRIENLEWCTQRENILHARDVLGVKYSKPGYENANAKFFESHRKILINLYNLGFSIMEISRIMCFSVPTITGHLNEIRKIDNKM